MKKLSLVATAVLGLISTTAMAQSTVTVYGIVDGGYNYVSGLRQGSVSTIASGIMDGSRFGLRGNEDIGGGYRAIFTLENRLELDTGAVSNRPNSGAQLPDRVTTSVVSSINASGIPLPAANLNALANGIANGNGTTSTGVNGQLGAGGAGVNLSGNLFDRQAFVGLVTPFGAFTLGRQYTPGYLVSATFDASQTQSSLAAGQIAGFPPAFDIRLNNTIQYGIQMSGVTATAMYGAGEVAGDSKKSRFLGLMAMYKASNFSVGFGHNQKKNDLGQDSLTNNVFGATVNVGPGTLYGQYATIKDNNPFLIPFNLGAGAAAATVAATPALAPLQSAIAASVQNAYVGAFRLDSRLMHIGYKITTGPHTIVTAFNRLDDKRLANADTDSYGVTYSYALSKRTSLNAVLTKFNNKGQGQAAPGGAGFLGGVTSAAGVDATNVALGVNHKF